tara:strand:- start:7 stop:309 length:303 start_codon:yes stop_codon:yes gene_type:complete
MGSAPNLSIHTGFKREAVSCRVANPAHIVNERAVAEFVVVNESGISGNNLVGESSGVILHIHIHTLLIFLFANKRVGNARVSLCHCVKLRAFHHCFIALF